MKYRLIQVDIEESFICLLFILEFFRQWKKKTYHIGTGMVVWYNSYIENNNLWRYLLKNCMVDFWLYGYIVLLIYVGIRFCKLSLFLVNFSFKHKRIDIINREEREIMAVGQITWEQFITSNHDARGVRYKFEDLCRQLFIYEFLSHNNKYKYVHSNPNNPGIESEPILVWRHYLQNHSSYCFSMFP